MDEGILVKDGYRKRVNKKSGATSIDGAPAKCITTFFLVPTSYTRGYHLSMAVIKSLKVDLIRLLSL